MDSYESSVVFESSTLADNTRRKITFSHLPTEVIEYTLLHCAMAGSPQSIASFSQTCRYFRRLVYYPADHHLWREVFLCEFDDPKLDKFEWGREYQRRFHGAALVLSPRLSEEMPLSDMVEPLLASTDSCSGVTQSVSAGDPRLAAGPTANMRDPKPPHPSYPIFPAADRYDCFASREVSKNVRWLKKTLRRGYPPEVARRYIISSGANSFERKERERFHKLLCRTGIPVYLPGEEGVGKIDAELQLKLRQWARKKVYNFRYIQRGRHWGPFLSTNPATHEDPPEREDTLAAFQNRLFGIGPAPEENATALPSSGQLAIDWEYLLGARIVMETNLKDVILGKHANDVLKGLLGLDGLRAGTSPGFTQPVAGSSINRDWAGVEGVWRRCVCWMDFRDLMINNIEADSNRFSDTGLGEAIRIIPMRLRAVSYSAAPKEWPDRPTIHVEGEHGGPLGSSDIRKVHGTVSMTGDGHVRYSLYTRKPEENQDEWVTEGIQIGDLGSAIGILGMWTGARHERNDPLGPFWAWKMA